MKRVVAITNECIGFAMVLCGMAGMDSESLVFPIAMVSAGALLMFAGSMIGGFDA